MKTERRHQIKENSLAHLISEYGPTVRPYVSFLGIAFIVLGLVWGGMGIMRSLRREQLATGWRAMFESLRSGDAAELRRIAEEHRNTPVAARALQAAGMLTLDEATPQLLTDRAEALEQLKVADEDFRSAFNLARGDKLLQSQIAMGWAQVHEARNDLEAARQEYEKVVNLAVNEAMVRQAADRIQFLELDDTKAFSAWFAEQKLPKPAASGSSERAASGPSAYDDLPENDLALPDESTLERSELGAMTPPESGSEKAADEENR